MADVKVFTLDDIAELLKVNKKILYNHIKDGKLKGSKVADKWVVTEEQFKDYIKNFR